MIIDVNLGNTDPEADPDDQVYSNVVKRRREKQI